MIRPMSSQRKALVRRPGNRLAEGIVTHVERRPVDAALALAQWERYVEALAAAGWEPVEVDPAEDCPDAVFVEDTLVVLGGVAVIARPGAPSRRPETEAAEQAVAALGFPVERIAAPGTLDGGDVLEVGEAVYVGTGGRTNAEGARRLAAILEPLGRDLVTVPVAGFLHLKSAVTALPDGTVVGCPPLAPDPGLFPRFLAVPEPSGAQVAVLGGGRLLLAADCPRTAGLYAGLGYEPVVVEIGELQKLEGCVTCLSVLVEG
jgi:dimethylargininase